MRIGLVLLSLFSGPHNFYNLLPQKFCITSYHKTHLFFSLVSEAWLGVGWCRLPWVSGLAEICSLVVMARYQRSTGNIQSILSLGLELARCHFWLILLAKASRTAAYPDKVEKFTNTEEVKHWGWEIIQSNLLQLWGGNFSIQHLKTVFIMQLAS